jgi:hypothetical protein
MSNRNGPRFNCRERALLPWLFLGAMAVAVLVIVQVKASAAPQQQSVPAPPAAPTPVFDVASIHLHIPEPH